MDYRIVWKDAGYHVGDAYRKANRAVFSQEFTKERAGIKSMVVHLEQDTAPEKELLAQQMANVIAGPVQNRMIEKMAEELLPELMEEEIEATVALTQQQAKRMGLCPENEGYTHKIQKRILECMDVTNELNIDGFLVFRMQDYTRAWHDCMEEVILRAVTEYEYSEYIRTLREILLSQETVIHTMELVLDEAGEFMLKGEEEGEGLNELVLPKVSRDAQGISQNDVVLCSLLCLAPQRLLVRNREKLAQNPLYETIERIFQERIVYLV